MYDNRLNIYYKTICIILTFLTGFICYYPVCFPHRIIEEYLRLTRAYRSFHKLPYFSIAFPGLTYSISIKNPRSLQSVRQTHFISLPCPSPFSSPARGEELFESSDSLFTVWFFKKGISLFRCGSLPLRSTRSAVLRRRTPMSGQAFLIRTVLLPRLSAVR